jgi:hypothetical protein
MKICSKCQENERLKWHHSYCRKCYLELDRRRYYKYREERLAKSQKYYQANKEKWIEKGKREDPKKKKARSTLRNHVHWKNRVIKKPCEVCGNPKSQGHHEDYDKPLEVIWLCSKHHGEKHRKYNEMGREV